MRREFRFCLTLLLLLVVMGSALSSVRAGAQRVPVILCVEDH